MAGTRSCDGLDFDAAVVGIASQPFWLRWADERGWRVSHAPDFFARRADGSAVVVDCRPVERRKPRDLAKFDATARACALVGWEYQLVGAPDAILTANLKWLSGYRHPMVCPHAARRWRHRHHRHIRPVLIREWSPKMDGIAGTIWASQSTSSTWPLRQPRT